MAMFWQFGDDVWVNVDHIVCVKRVETGAPAPVKCQVFPAGPSPFPEGLTLEGEQAERLLVYLRGPR